MRGVTIQQLLFLAFIILLPMIEQLIKRRKRTSAPPREIEPDDKRMYEEAEPESYEAYSYDDEVEAAPLPPPTPPAPPRPRPEPVVLRRPEPVVYRQPEPVAHRQPDLVVRQAPAYVRRPIGRVPALAAPGTPPATVRRRAPRITAREARRGVVLMEVLGACVALREEQRDQGRKL